MASKKLTAFYFAAFMAILLVSCQKQDPLVVSKEGTNDFYHLPQGDHPYDAQILAFYNKYQCFILYKFDSVDYNYNLTSIVNQKLSVLPADSNYVSEALSYLHKNLFDVYPEDFLQKTMPFSILLSSRIKVDSFNVYSENASYYTAYSSLRSVSFGLVSDTLTTMTGPQLDSARGWLHTAFWQLALGNGFVSYPNGFDSLSIHGTNAVIVQANMRKYGIFPITTDMNFFHVFDDNADFLAYIQEITSTDSTTFAKRWLTPQVDISGLYKKKYELIVDFYKTHYGINLQAIGDLKN